MANGIPEWFNDAMDSKLEPLKKVLEGLIADVADLKSRKTSGVSASLISKALLEELKKDPESCRDILNQLYKCEDETPIAKKDCDERERRRCRNSTQTGQRILDANDVWDAYQRAFWGTLVLWGFPYRFAIRSMN
jgi:hypothetical protein